jgi:hypothetical protein
MWPFTSSPEEEATRDAIRDAGGISKPDEDDDDDKPSPPPRRPEPDDDDDDEPVHPEGYQNA